MKRGNLSILLVEDDENDTFFVRRAVLHADRGHTVHPVSDATEAIKYLQGEGRYHNREEFPVPNVILTDIKMPLMDGFEFLQWLKTNRSVLIIPIIVYSSSSQERDIRRAYELGANAYITKPHSYETLASTLHSIYDFWSRCEVPPPHPN